MNLPDRESSIDPVEPSGARMEEAPCPAGRPEDATAAKPRGRFTRRKFFRTVIYGGAALATADAWLIEPRWVDYREQLLKIANLPAEFHGMRIAHLTDMHLSELSPVDYQRKVIQQVNRLKVDLVAVTGDLITDDVQFIKPVCQLLGELEAPVMVSFGNHDYYPIKPAPGKNLAQIMEEELIRQGCQVLRNRSVAVDRGGRRLWVAGMEDHWMGNFSPKEAFKGLPAGEPVIALTHNPDTVYDLLPYKPAVILAGHTHGGQICLPFLTKIILPMQHKQFQKGLFKLDQTRMYVSRGVGCLSLGLRFRCRPEVPIHILQRADA